MKPKPKQQPYTILFICSGNSCRSPMAEGLLRKMLYPKYGDKVRIHSSGTLGINNNPATLHAIQVALEKGVDISAHRSKGLTRADMALADIVFAMSENHLEFIQRYLPEFKENTFLLKSFATGSDKPRHNSIDDPIGQSIKTYRKCINEIEKELTRILPQIERFIQMKFNS